MRGEGQVSALLYLFLAAALWAVGYPATKWGLESFAVFDLCLVRCVLAALVLTPVALRFPISRGELQFAFLQGALFSAILGLQVLALERTSTANAIFFSNLYVLFIPLFLWVGWRARPSVWLLLCFPLAVAGIYFTAEEDWSRLQLGDVFALLAALISAFQIISLERWNDRITSATRFVTIQFYIAAAFFALARVFMSETAPDISTITPFAWVGLGILVVGSTIGAFALQILGLRKISATVSGYIFLLEIPLAVFFAFLMLRETVIYDQLIGGLLILLAAIIAVAVG
ncbi:MAG: DMT family transporter [Bdellovibrionales bacterium]|nr:DMT family transporter [Bdellovibrionales bacterium]